MENAQIGPNWAFSDKLYIAIFKKNIARFPNKSDAYDSLADGYEANGDLAMALEMREKALAMSYEENVENGAFKTRLANLRKKIAEGTGD